MIPVSRNAITNRCLSWIGNGNNFRILLRHSFLPVLRRSRSSHVRPPAVAFNFPSGSQLHSSFSTFQQTLEINTNIQASSSNIIKAAGRTKRDAITITPRAAQRILTLLAQPSAADAIGIRLGVRRRGCNGLSYTLNYAMESDRHTKGMEEVSTHGVTVLIEPMALFSVVGTTMDWVETDLSSEFVFENPNSKGKCGCGESFNV